jgi:hypothetical protein
MSGLWVLEDVDTTVPVVKMMLKYQEVFLENFVQLPHELLDGILRRVMFKSDARLTPDKSGGLTQQEVAKGLKFVGITPQRLILDMLNHVPTGSNGERKQWGPISGLTVGKLMDMPLARTDTDVGKGYRGWEHSVVDTLEFIDVFSGFSIDSLASAGVVKHETSPEELKRKVESPLTRMACQDVLMGTLNPLRKLTISDALRREVKSDGLYPGGFNGAPEVVAKDLSTEYGRFSWGQAAYAVKTLAANEPCGTLSLSVYRARRNIEDTPEVRLYDIHAFLHEAEKLVARVMLTLAITTNPDARALGMVFDLLDESDIREIGLGLAREDRGGRLAGKDLSGTLIVRRWEVIEGYRRKGWGRRLLNEAASQGCKGLRKPTFATMRFKPLSQVEPLFDDWPESYLPELHQPFIELKTIVKQTLRADTYLGKTVAEIYPAPHVWQCHANYGVQLWAMGALSLGRWD